MNPEIQAADRDVVTTEADAVVVAVSADAGLTGPAADLDKATDGLISRLVESKEITAKKCEITPILGAAGARARQLVVVGLGKADRAGGLDADVAFRAAATAARHLAAKERGRIAYFLADDWSPRLIESGLAGALVGCQGMEMPNFSHPGSLKYQRYQAHRFDPYPEPGVGPAMPESRPRSYIRPPVEPSRARWTRAGY